MKKTSYITVVALTLFVACHCALAQSATDAHSIAFGVRQHATHEEFADLPYDDGDIGYIFAYEYGNEDAYWQMAVDYVSSPGGNTVADENVNNADNIDYVITPQINLLLRDGIWRAGVGGMMTYFEGDDDYTGDEWSDLYWQVMLGLGIPISQLNLTVYAHYVFEAWDEFSDFEVDELEYSAALTLTF